MLTPRWFSKRLNLTIDLATAVPLLALASQAAHGSAPGLSATGVLFGWVIVADPAGNEFCVEISRAEMDAAQAAHQADA